MVDIISTYESARPGAATGTHIAMASVRDARDPHAWSGTPFYMGQALEQNVERLSYIGPVEAPVITTISKAARLQSRFTGWKTMPSATWFAARRNARILQEALAQAKPDVVFAPAGSTIIAALETDLPVIYTSDATVRLMIDYYGQFSDLSKHARQEAEDLERAAIAKSALLVYPTAWVARSAVEDYGADPARIRILPYGANLAHFPARETALAPRRPGPLRLVFVGVDWIRKGGDIAMEAFRELRRRGVDAEMTIVGCVPPPEVPRDGLTIYPFLSKNDPAQMRMLSEIYLSGDLFFVPTRAECYGVVWCEAAAHGLPSVSTATGGVPDVIREGVTGMTLPQEARGADYADLIATLAADPARLAALKRSAREDFETRLDWAVWGRDLARLAGEIRDGLGQPRAAS
jgi:glycosyltransferase involved in cell wall biosynthesis